jgi:type II secretory pathway pseudopilin PulG
MVVIAIIAVLIAILLPVYRSAREHTRQRACMANLFQIATAIRMYRMDEGAYPGPYEPVTGEGALNALYPYYLDNRNALLCPDDEIKGPTEYLANAEFAALLEAAANIYTPANYYFKNLWSDPNFFKEHYSSYNALYNWMGYVNYDPATFSGNYQIWPLGGGIGGLPVTQHMDIGDNIAWWYEWFRWDPENKLNYAMNPSYFTTVDRYLHYALGEQVYWWAYPNSPEDPNIRLRDALSRPLWDYGDPAVFPYGEPSAVFPGLIDRNAPDNTIVTRCPHHRAWTVVRIPRSGGPGGGGPGRPGQRGPGVTTKYERDETPRDIVLRLDGSAALVRGYGYDWARQPRL